MQNSSNVHWFTTESAEEHGAHGDKGMVMATAKSLRVKVKRSIYRYLLNYSSSGIQSPVLAISH